MNRLFYSLLLLVPYLALYGQSKITVSENEVFNTIVKGFSGYPESPTGYFISLQVEKANQQGGVFRNVVRLWFGEGINEYINLLYQVFPSEGLAKAALTEEINNDGNVLLMNWDAVKGTSMVVSLKNTHFSEQSCKSVSAMPTKMKLIQNEFLTVERVAERLSVVERPDGKNKRFTLPNYVTDADDVQVFVDGKILKPSKIKVYPTKKCIVFKRAPKKGKSITISNTVTLQEVIFNVSFEGLTIDEGLSCLKGQDSDTEFNADYYSWTKKNLILQGTAGKAWPEIEDAPGRDSKALRMKAVNANDQDVSGDKVRVTCSVAGLNAVEIVNSVDIYVPETWESLTESEEGISWLTVQEYWCSSAGIPVDGEPQFRMTLGMLKKAGKGERMYFDVKAEDITTKVNSDGSLNEKRTVIYELDDRDNKKFEIPFGEWFNLRTEIVSGDMSSGRFRLVASFNMGNEVVIFDNICQTFATGYMDLNTKRPLYKSESPLKLYTSDKMLQRMNGLPLEIYYDNWNYKALCISDE